MKDFKLFALLAVTNLIFSQNTVPSSGPVNFDSSLKIGNQISPSGEGQITRMMLTPYRHTGGPWNIISRDNADNAFLDFDYGTWGTALTMSSERNVGIGVKNPTAKFEVLNSLNTNNNEVIASFSRLGTGTGGSSIIRLGYHDNCDLEVNSGYTLNGLRFGSYFDLNIINNKKGGDHGAINFVTNESIKMAIKSNGNVGIGTFNPQAKLHVNNGDNSYGTILANSSEAAFSLYAKSITTQPINVEAFRLGMKYDNQEENGFISFYRGSSASGGFLGFSSSGVERMRINEYGNIGIGISNPQNKLDVNGTIHSKEVKVDMDGWSWPDFVFKKEYSLPTLEEVEKHIVEKGHLENIPSEEEVLKNGINLGEMNAKLLQKIEELTLYMIELKKENGVMKKENGQLQSNQRILEERIKKIERDNDEKNNNSTGSISDRK